MLQNGFNKKLMTTLQKAYWEVNWPPQSLEHYCFNELLFWFHDY